MLKRSTRTVSDIMWGARQSKYKMPPKLQNSCFKSNHGACGATTTKIMHSGFSTLHKRTKYDTKTKEDAFLQPIV